MNSIKNISQGVNSNSARPDVQINPYQRIAAILNQPLSIAKSTFEETDVNGLKTLYTVDDMGNIIEVESPTTGIITYSYDNNNLLIGSQSSLNSQQYKRDTLGRILSIKVNGLDGITEAHTIEWGQHNKPTKISYPAGYETFSYNHAAQLETHTQKVDHKVFSLTEPPRDCRRLNFLREYDNENTKLYP